MDGSSRRRWPWRPREWLVPLLGLIAMLLGPALAQAGDRPGRQAPVLSGDERPRAAQPAGELEILRRSPDDGDDEIGISTPLLVQFNTTVQPLTAPTAAPVRPVLQIDPPVAGEGQWLTSSMYRFRPAGGWDPSTLYTVRLLPAVAGLQGERAAGPSVWRFTTVSPAVAQVSPGQNTQQVPTTPGRPPPGPVEMPASPAGVITVRFNQPVDRVAAERALSFSPPIGGAASWPDDSTLVLTPSAPLARDTRYTGTVVAGVPAAGGGAVSRSPFTWSFMTAGLPGVTRTNPTPDAETSNLNNIQFMFNTPMDRESVEQRLTIEPAPERTPAFTWSPTDNALSIQYLGRPRTQYRVTLAAGARDRFDQEIGSAFTLNFRTAPLPRSLSLAAEDRASVFFAGTRPRVVLSTTNVADADLTLYRLTRDSFINVLGATLSDAVELRRWQVPIGDATPDRRVETTVDVADEPLPPGYYLLVTPTTTSGNQPPFAVRFLVTRSHLTLKRSYDELLVWAVDAAGGAPLAGLPLQAHNRDGGLLGTGVTDADGIAALRVPPPAMLPQSLLIVTGQRTDDEVFVSTDWTDSGGFPYAASLIGSMNSERPLYRPGETVYFQGIVRRDDDAALTLPDTQTGFSVRVTDSRFREVFSRPVTVDEYGSFDGEVALDPAAAIGSYSLALMAGPDRRAVTSATFRVAEFRRPEFSVEVVADHPDYESGDRIAVAAGARLFLGAPLGGAGVRWTVSAMPLRFSPPDFRGYTFVDSDDLDSRGMRAERPTGQGMTDRGGMYVFAVPSDLSMDRVGQEFTVEATVTDVDNQAISARTRLRVHKAAGYAGLRPREYLGTAGRPLTVDLVSVDRTGRPAGGETLSVRILERRFNRVVERLPNGTETVEYRPVDTEIETRTVRTGVDGRAEIPFTPSRGGLYRVAVSGRDSAGREYRSAVAIYVAGPDYVPWLVRRLDRMELVADRTEYRPGDVARVLVPAPFAGAIGLVTVERQGIISRRIQRFDSNSVTLEIPIERRHLPNVFVSVALFRPPEGETPGQSYAAGQVELTVSAEEQRLQVAVTPDTPAAGPRDTVTFAVRTTDASGAGVPAELAMAVVDEAVLSLVEARAGDAFDVLYRRRPPGVQTVRNAVAAATARPASAARTPTPTVRPPTPAPTPAAAVAPVPQAAPLEADLDVRSDFRLTAHWQPALRTDAQGNGRLSVRMPDTLTTWRLIARAITRDSKAGTAEAKVVTRKLLVVRPVAPRFLTAGDRPALGAIVHNFTGAPLDVRVSLAGEGIAVDGDAAHTVRIDAEGQIVLSWRATLSEGGPSPPERVTLRFAAVGGGLSDAVELNLPVYALATPEVVASSGAVRDRATEVIRGPDAMGARSEEIRLDLWPSLTAALPETVRELRAFWWESAETTASRLLTEIGVAQAQGVAPDTGRTDEWLRRLLDAQQSDGGWGWYRGSPTDAVTTAYVLIALSAAADADRPVSPAAFMRAAGYLRMELDRPRDLGFDLNPSTRALLAHAHAAASGELDRVFDLAAARDTLGPEGKALLALAMQRGGIAADDARLRPLLADLIGSATISAAAASWDDPVGRPARLTTATRTTAFALRALAHADAEHPLVDDAVRWLMNERREGRWSTSQESALVVLALGAVAAARGEGEAAFSYRVALGDRLVHEATVERAGNASPETLSLRERLGPGDTRLALTREPVEAPGRLYYRLSYRSTTPARAIGALDHGIAVAREFLSPDDDRPLSHIKAGDLVKVRVTVLASATMNYVSLEDYLPAGLEPVDTSLKTTSREVGRILEEDARRRALSRNDACLFRYSRGYCSSPFGHTDQRDDRVVVLARTLPKGAHDFVYLARATTPGTYEVRPTRVSEVYFPDVWGRTDSGVVVVEP